MPLSICVPVNNPLANSVCPAFNEPYVANPIPLVNASLPPILLKASAIGSLKVCWSATISIPRCPRLLSDAPKSRTFASSIIAVARGLLEENIVPVVVALTPSPDNSSIS